MVSDRFDGGFDRRDGIAALMMTRLEGLLDVTQLQMRRCSFRNGDTCQQAVAVDFPPGRDGPERSADGCLGVVDAEKEGRTDVDAAEARFARCDAYKAFDEEVDYSAVGIVVVAVARLTLPVVPLPCLVVAPRSI